jgi:Tfp pilus assembly protein PilN
MKFEGVAQSSTRVSAFMRNIDGSTYLKNPELEVVRTEKSATTGASFVLYADQAGAPVEAEGADSNKPKRRIASAGG